MSSRSSHLTLAALSLVAVALVGADELPADAASRPPASPPPVAGIVIPEFPVESEAVGSDPQAPRTLTPGQLAKLARARVAVERARAAGTLEILSPPAVEWGPPLSVEAIEEMKLEMLRRQEPLPYGPVEDIDRPEEVE